MTVLTGLGVEIDRLADRLRSLPFSRLEAPWPPHASRAEAALALAQRLADRAADAQGHPRREVPDAGPGAVGDQVAVTGAELLASGASDEALIEAAAEVRALRLSL